MLVEVKKEELKNNDFITIEFMNIHGRQRSISGRLDNIHIDKLDIEGHYTQHITQLPYNKIIRIYKQVDG